MTSLFWLLSCLSFVACASPGRGGSADIRTEELTYEAGGAVCKGYLAYDAARSGQRPGVLVVHEWWGATEYTRRRARMLAELGYTALALDMYGDGKLADHPDDAGKFMNEVFANMDQGTARFDAARQLLQDHVTTDPERIGAIGYCFGGAVALNMARMGKDLDCVASFHGNLATQHPAEPGEVKARVLVCHGAADQLVPAEQVQAFRQEMSDVGVDLTFVAYPGAKHAFTNPEADEKAARFGLPLGYDQYADQQSWQELVAFLSATWR